MPPIGRKEISSPTSVVGWLTADRAVTLVSQFVIAIAVARYLGPAGYGVLTAITAVVTMLMLVQRMGFDSIVAAELIHSPDQIPLAIGTSIRARRTAGVVLGLALVISCFTFVEDGMIRIGLLVSVVALVVMPFDIYRHLADLQLRTPSYMLARWATLGLVLLVNIAFLVAEAPLLYFVVWQSIGIAIVVSIPGIAAKHVIGQVTERRLDRGLLRRALTLTVATVALAVYLKVDIIMLAVLTGPTETGYYGAAARISSAPSFVTGILLAAYAASVPRARTPKSFDALNLTTAAAICWTGLVVVFAPILVQGLFGSEYSPAVDVLRIHSASFLFLAWGDVRNRWFTGASLERSTAIGGSIGAAINAGLNLILIPTYGALGAAWATVISYAVAVYVFTLIPRRLRFFNSAVHDAIIKTPQSLREFFRTTLARFRATDAE